MFRHFLDRVGRFHTSRSTGRNTTPEPTDRKISFRPLSMDWTRELASLPEPARVEGPISSAPSVIAVGSGKGGVGKTIVSSNLALALSRHDRDPLTAIDVDLGGANLHAGLGIARPTFALNRFVLEDTPLDRLSAPTEMDGLDYISGASDIVGLTEFSEIHRQRFLEELTTLRARTIVLDLGAGSSLFNLDVFCLAGSGVLVTTTEPTAVENAYGFLRAAVYRRLRPLIDGEDGLVEILEDAMNHRGNDETDSIPALVRECKRYNREAANRLEEVVERVDVGVIINMAEPRRAKEVAEKLARVTEKYLGMRLAFLGNVATDETVRRAICECRPLVPHFPKSRAARDLRAIADRLAERMEHREAMTA